MNIRFGISRDTLVLNASHIVMDGMFASVPILLSFIVLYFGANEKSAGIIISLGGVLMTLGGLSTKFFSARLGLWATMGLVLLVTGGSFTLNAFAPHLAVAGMFFIFSVSGMGLFHALTFAHITAIEDRRNLGKALGDYTAIGDIGRIPVASLAGFGAAMTLAGQPGWRIVCLVYGIATCGVAAGLLWKGLRERAAARALAEQASCPDFQAAASQGEAAPAEAAPGEPAAPEGRLARMRKHLPSFALLRRREVALPMFTNILDGFASTSIFTFLPFLLFAKGIDAAAVGGFALAFTVGSFIGKSICGRLAGRFGARPVFVGTELCMVALLLITVSVHEVWLIIALCGMLGMATTGTVPSMQTLLVEPVSGKAQYEDIFSLSSLLRGGITMLAPLLYGFMATALSIESAYVLMACVGVLAVTPLLLMGRVRRA